MKTVILLRHAKSSWSDADLDDALRPLNERGQRDAPRMGAWLEQQGLRPDLILCSTAARTRETLDLIKPHLDATIKTALRKSLYLATPAIILKAIRAAPPAAKTIMIIGHNPGLEDVAQALAGSGSFAAAAMMSEKFPTAAAAVITFDVAAWTDIADGRGNLAGFMTPKLLDAE